MKIATGFQPSDFCSTTTPTKETNTPVSRKAKQSRRTRSTDIGFFALFITAIVSLALGSTTLGAMVNDVETSQLEAAEAVRPANISMIALIAPGCTRCTNVTSLTNSIAQNKKVNVMNSQTVDYQSPEGSALVKQYGLNRIPTFVLQGETEKLLQLLPQLAAYGAQSGPDFIGQNLSAPYVQVTDGQVRGDFDAVYITEKQCSECYDPTLNRQALRQLGMSPNHERIVDRSDPEGQKLVNQYALTTTPSVILTGDLAAYSGFERVWNNVGTIEPDGAYVFRTGHDLMGTSYDLASKKAVVPKPQTQKQ